MSNLEKDLITVIVPVYNVEKYLNECLTSIINQTYRNIEIIIVDDGSKDTSGEICDRFAKLDDRILVIHKQNGGLSSARNAALDILNGAYVMFVDSDDWLELNMLQSLYAYIIENELDIAACSSESYEEDTEKTEIYPLVNSYIYDSKFAVQDILGIQKYNLEPVQQKLYKSFLFENIRFKEGMIHEDTSISCVLLGNSQKIGFLAVPLYHYRIRAGSILRQPYNKKKIHQVLAYKSLVPYVENKYPEYLGLLYDRMISSALFNILVIKIIDEKNYEKELIICEHAIKENLKKSSHNKKNVKFIARVILAFPKTCGIILRLNKIWLVKKLNIVL
ncbi:glycosyltransferase [Holdemania massiliensis]|uniref:glycosyltransferase n=1 Tax=Holdemania massiliensis TaxID=1468449 RepID=UPI0026773786|nr:glycosyltransferase [Holdemania massiliensis]